MANTAELAALASLNLNIPPSSPDSPVYESPCACLECGLQWYATSDQKSAQFQYTGAVDDTQAANIIKDKLERIQADRKWLSEAIKTNGDRILIRWQKRSPAKRIKFLKEVDPELLERRVDFHQEFRTMPWNEARDKCHRAHLLPYLNVNTLAGNASLLIGLIHHRTFSEPEDWVHYDYDVVDTAWVFGLVCIYFNSHCVVMGGNEFRK